MIRESFFHPFVTVDSAIPVVPSAWDGVELTQPALTERDQERHTSRPAGTPLRTEGPWV